MPKAIDRSKDAPWKQRFRAPLIISTQLAKANPRRGVVVSNRDSSSFQLYAWDVPSGTLRQLTDRLDGVVEGWIAPDGQYVYFLDDRQGNELGHLVRVPFDGGAPEDLTPDMQPYTLRGVGWSRDGSQLAFNPINADGFQLYVITLSPNGEVGAPKLIHQSQQEAWGALLSYDGRTTAMFSTARAGGRRNYSLLAFDTTSSDQLGEVWDGQESSVETIMFSPVSGDDRVLATTNRSGFRRPLIWNPRTGDRLDLPFEDLEGEVIPLDWSDDGSQLLLCQSHRAEQQLYTYNLINHTLIRLQHPSGTFYVQDMSGAYFGSSDEIFTLWEDSTHPPQLIALDAHTGTLQRTLLTAGNVPTGRAWRSVLFPSSDRQEIQGWLAVPHGDGPFPTILEMHGGPHFVTPNFFNPSSQAWLDHGYAFLSINFRGSTTFGRAFKEQIWGNIGHWELEDMAAARAWLIEHGIARPDAVFLHGGSYGGYLTLLGLGKQPDLWAGGIAIVAIADLTINYEDASDALKGAFAAWFGGSPAEKPEQYRAASPITYVEQVQAPVFIIQGRHDSRTTARQIEVYEAKMRAAGKQIEVEWFDAGHGSLDIEQMIEHQELMLSFAERVLADSKTT